MLVLNTTSPSFSPGAPNARPVYTVPSSRASFAVVIGPRVCRGSGVGSQIRSMIRVGRRRDDGTTRKPTRRDGRALRGVVSLTDARSQQPVLREGLADLRLAGRVERVH